MQTEHIIADISEFAVPYCLLNHESFKRHPNTVCPSIAVSEPSSTLLSSVARDTQRPYMDYVINSAVRLRVNLAPTSPDVHHFHEGLQGNQISVILPPFSGLRVVNTAINIEFSRVCVARDFSPLLRGLRGDILIAGSYANQSRSEFDNSSTWLRQPPTNGQLRFLRPVLVPVFARAKLARPPVAIDKSCLRSLRLLRRARHYDMTKMW